MSAKPDKRHQLSKVVERVKDVSHWMLSNFIILNTDKTDILLLVPQAARSKLSGYILSLDGLSVMSCAAMKDFGVIIDPLYHYMMQKTSSYFWLSLLVLLS